MSTEKAMPSDNILPKYRPEKPTPVAIVRLVLSNGRELFRPHDSILLEYYTFLVSQLPDDSLRTFASVDEARNTYLAALPPGSPVDAIVGMEWRQVAIQRIFAFWMIFWVLIVPVMATVWTLRKAVHVAWARGDAMTLVFWFIIGGFLYYVFLFIGLRIQAVIARPFYGRLIGPMLGLEYSRPHQDDGRSEESRQPQNPGSHSDTL